MTTPAAQSLDELVRDAGQAWMLGQRTSLGNAVARLRDLLNRVDQTAQQRFVQGTLRLTEEKLLAEHKRHPHKVRAFLEAMGESHSPEILLMVWRVLQGMEIQHIRIDYSLEDHFHLEVELRSPYGEPVENYQSSDIDDVAMIRHLGILKMDGKPVFDGFYATDIR